MPFDEYRAESCCNREPITIVPIHLQRCDQEFGVTCNGTGEPCYQTIQTCKDKCNFQCEIRDNIHTSCSTSQVGLHRNDIKDEPTFSGGKLKLCGGMPGPRTVTIPLQDTDSCDIIDDPYSEQRQHFGSKAPGTELEKFKHRHILEGRRFSVQSGFCGAAYPDTFIDRTYYIDSFDGPDANCCFSLKGKDALGFFNLADTKWPAEANYKTVADIPIFNDVGDLIALDPDTSDDAEVICIGGEAIKIEVSPTQVGTDRKLFTIIERDSCGSTKATDAIKAGTDYKIGGYIKEGLNAGDFIFQLLHQDGEGLPWQAQDCDCGPFQDAVIDATQFGEMISGCASHLVLPETVICQPTSIRELLKEIEAMSLLKPVMNDESGMIELYLHQPPTDVQNLNCYTEDMMLRFDVSAAPTSKHVTHTIIKSHPIDCTKGVTDENLVSTYANLNESFFGDACTNPEWRPRKVKEVKTRFLNTSNEFLGQTATSRLNYLLNQAPREVKFQVPAKFMVNRESDYICIDNPKLQTAAGDLSNDIFWITQIAQQGSCFEITAETSNFYKDQRWLGFTDNECTTLVSTTNTECADTCRAAIW